MDMHGDKAVLEGTHGVAENVPGGSLHDIFHELRTIGFESFPFFRAANALIGNAVPTKLVLANLWLHIGQLPTGRKGNKHHPAPVGKRNTRNILVDMLLDSIHGRPVHIPPKSNNIGVGGTPSVHQRMEFLFGQAHLQSPHCFQGTDAAAIAESQFCNFAFLPQMTIDTVLFHGHFKHLTGRCAVNVAAVCKDILPPLFPGKPSQHSGLNGRKIRNNEFVTGFGDKGGADQLGQRIRHIFVQHLYGLKISVSNKGTGLRQIRQMILGQILHLNDTPGPPTSSIGPVELEHPTSTTVGAHGLFHGLIFLNRGFRQLLPEQKNFPLVRRCGFYGLGHSLFSKGIQFQPILRKPLLHLLDRIGIFQFGQPFHASKEFLTGTGIHFNGLMDQIHIQRDTPVIDLLINVIFLPDRLRDRELGKFGLNGHFHFHIAHVVITDIAAGPFGSNLKVECFVPSGFPIIDGANLKGYKVTDNLTKFVTEEKARSLSRSIAHRGDVVVTISGTLESLNSTGKELSESDLIRNYVLMGLEPSEQTYVYEHLWRPMEQLFVYETQDSVMDSFFRHYLTMKLTRIPKQGRVYEEFKLYHLNCEFGTIRELCQDLLNYAKFYTDIVFKRSNNAELKRLYEDIVDLRMEVSYPFLLKVHNDCAEGTITEDNLKEILRLCISYVLRRSICDIPTNSMNKTFATLRNSIRPDDYMNSVKAFFVLQDTYKEFPDNDKFVAAFMSRDIYTMRARNYILSRLENFGNKAPIIIENYTIEHIMPQNTSLSPEWQHDLGVNWKEIQKTYIHTIGNLTLTAYNSEMSDRPFMDKMNMPGGFKESALRLNAYLVKLTEWNEDHIKERAQQLAAKAVQIWPYPSLTNAELAPYTAEEKSAPKYTLETYDINAFTKILFETLDRRIMNLSPAVKREYKKLYIAYKLDTNFVDIVVQKQRLRISVNMKFFEVYDPNGICRDVTGLGRWGNGDVELFMEHTSDIDRVMEIIEQSYKLQAD